MNPNKHDRGPQDADELLHAAERALFDATARLQEALVLIDREGLETSPDMLERVRHWSALIHRGLSRLNARERLPRLTHSSALEA
ncbi:MAG: hypothetical protein KUG77_05070 [Nannocystaceae bacterium]|nr:hypothetical protein [Nannocystaceae bacterium]